MTERATPGRGLDRRTLGVLAGWGLLVWGPVAVRLFGHVRLDRNRGLVVAFVVSVVPLMALVTYPVYRRSAIPFRRRGAAAAAMSVPGMFLDVLLVVAAEAVFPATETASIVNFGAILLFGHAVVLLTGFVPGSSSASG